MHLEHSAKSHTVIIVNTVNIKLIVEPYCINKTDDWQECLICIFELNIVAMQALL